MSADTASAGHPHRRPGGSIWGSIWRSGWGSFALLVVAACLPLLSLLPDGTGFLAHPDSELPVRLWGLDIMPQVGWLGGMVSAVGHPHPGPLNNPDPIGTVFVFLVRPLVGLAWAWNALIVVQLLANMLATRALVRAWLDDETAALTAALGIGFMPLALSYGIGSAIVDTLALWPYALGLHALLRVSRADRPRRAGAWAGLWAGLGLLSSPYVFVVALSGLPVGLLLTAPRWLKGLRQPDTRRPWVGGLGSAGLVGGLLCAAVAGDLWWIMHAQGSQMASDYVAFTRTAPPWDSLRPGHPGQLQATLAEYFSWGSAGLKQRDTASHYMRTTAIPWVLWGLAALGAWRTSPGGTSGGAGTVRAARIWLGIALVAVLASTGPFLCVTDRIALTLPLNPAFYYSHYLSPGGSLLLESFRYGALAAFAVTMAAAVGLARLGRSHRTGPVLAALMPLALLAEVLLLSPVPVPLPVAHPQVSAAYRHLDEVLPAGAIIELPFTDGDTGRFSRIHFLNQRTHKRPIADQVRGWPPDLILNNALLHALVAAEALEDPATYDPTAPPRPYRRLKLDDRVRGDVPQARQALVSAGFVGIIINPQAYTSSLSLRQVKRLLGTDSVTLDDRLIYPLQAQHNNRPRTR